MENPNTLNGHEGGMSRKNFFAAVSGAGIAAVSAATPVNAAVFGVPAPGNPTETSIPGAVDRICLSTSFSGNLDERGVMVFSHGLGESLPSDILSVSAFISLPGGQVRNISVEYVDKTSIAVAGGVANAAVRVSVVYSRLSAS